MTLAGEADRLVEHPADHGRPLLERRGDLQGEAVDGASGAGGAHPRVPLPDAAGLQERTKFGPGRRQVERGDGDFAGEPLHHVHRHERIVGDLRRHRRGDLEVLGIRRCGRRFLRRDHHLWRDEEVLLDRGH